MSDKKDLEKDALRLKMQKYADWYINTYKDIVHFSDFQKRHIKYNWIAESLSKFNEKGNNKSPIYYSSIWRHEVLDNLKYYLSPKRTEHIVTVFKMDRTKTMGHDRSAEFHTTFAFLYSSEENGKYEHDFVCLGPTFQSADGEYRRRFITFRQFKHVMEQFKELVAPVTEQIVKWMAKKSMGIQLESFFPKYLKDQKGFDKIQKSFLEKLDTDRLIIEIYAAVWLLEYKRFDDRTQENHLVPGYKEAMFSRQDEKFYHDVIKKIPSSQNGLFNALMEHVMPYPGKSYNPVIAGQKFIPLRVKDVEECENIKHAPWREMYIASLVGDLVINGISPGFPIFADWFFIQTNSPDIWDNKVSHLKLDHSMVASDIVKTLEQARKFTYDYGEKGEPAFITYQMEGMSDAIEVSMDYAEKEIILAPVTLCSLVEHCGRTFADLPNMINREFYRKETGDLLLDEKIFAKYLFEYIYSIYSMNVHLNLIHSDLHLNNITLYSIRPYYANIHDDSETIPIVRNAHVVYDIGALESSDPADVYVFPHYGRYATIIDFSRGVLGREQLMKDFPEATADQIISNQRKRLLKTFARELPDFYKAHSTDLEAFFLQNFDLAFKLLTALDVYKLTKGMLGLVAHNLQLKTHPNIVALLEKVNSKALDVLTIDMQKAFRREIKEYDFPNVRILKECFGQYVLDKFDQKASHRDDPESPIAIVDVWQVRNPMEFSGRSYDKFPTTIKFDYVEKNDIPTEKTGLKQFHKIQKYQATNPEERIEEIAETLRNSKAERRGTPEPIRKKPTLEHNEDKAEMDPLMSSSPL